MANDTIPFFGLDRQYRTIKEELLDAIDTVYSSGRMLDGAYTVAFEEQIAARCDRKYAVAVNSGTQALVFSLLSTLQEPPYGVLIPTLSFAATLNSVLMSNYVANFCDVDHKGLMNLDSYGERIDQTVGAVMYVNLFGNTVDWPRFQMQTRFFNKDLIIIEDAAQSFGASHRGVPSGKMGDVSILSFDPTKNLPNYGSGGMILTDNHEIYDTCLNFRNNGKPSEHEITGTNSKMSEADCAQMLVKLKYFDQWQQRRAEIAEYYIEELFKYVDIVLPTEGTIHAWHKFVLRTSNRNGLMNCLSRNFIECKMHYDRALYDLPVGNLLTFDHHVETNQFVKQCVSLPIYPELTDGEVERVVEVIKHYYSD